MFKNLSLFLVVLLASATPALAAPKTAWHYDPSSPLTGNQDWGAVAVGPDGIVYLIDQARDSNETFTDIRCTRIDPADPAHPTHPTALVSPRGPSVDEQDQPYAAFVRDGYVYVAGSTYSAHYPNSQVPDNSKADWYVMRFDADNCNHDSGWPSSSPGAIIFNDNFPGRQSASCTSTQSCYDELNGLYVDSSSQNIYLSGYLNANNPGGTNNPSESSVGLAKFRVEDGTLRWSHSWHPSSGKVDSTDGSLVVDESNSKIYLTGRKGDCSYGAIGDIHCVSGHELSRGFIAQFADGPTEPVDPTLNTTLEEWDRQVKPVVYDRAYDQGFGLVSDGIYLYVVGARRFKNSTNGVTNDNVEVYVRRFSIASFGSQGETVARYQETEPATFFTRNIGVDPATQTIYVAMNRGSETGAPGRIELLKLKPGAITGGTTSSGDDATSPAVPNFSASTAEVEKLTYSIDKTVAARNIAVAYPYVYVAGSADSTSFGTNPTLIAFGPTTFSDDFAGSTSLPRAWTAPVTGSYASLALASAASLDGDGQGLLGTITAGNPAAAYWYLRSTEAASRTHWKARVWVKPQGLTMTDGEKFTVLRGIGQIGTNVAQNVAQLEIERTVVSGSSKIRALLEVSSADTIGPSPTSLPSVILDPLDGSGPTARHLEIEWWSASTPDASDGGASITDLGTSATSSVTSLDNYTNTVTEAQLGVVSGVDANTSGTIQLDHYESIAP